MREVFKKNQQANRRSLYPQPKVQIRIRDIKIALATFLAYTIILLCFLMVT